MRSKIQVSLLVRELGDPKTARRSMHSCMFTEFVWIPCICRNLYCNVAPLSVGFWYIVINATSVLKLAYPKLTLILIHSQFAIDEMH